MLLIVLYRFMSIEQGLVEDPAANPSDLVPESNTIQVRFTNFSTNLPYIDVMFAGTDDRRHILARRLEHIYMTTCHLCCCHFR